MKALLLLTYVATLRGKLLAHGGHPPAETSAIHGIWHALPLLLALLVLVAGLYLFRERRRHLPVKIRCERDNSNSIPRK